MQVLNIIKYYCAANEPEYTPLYLTFYFQHTCRCEHYKYYCADNEPEYLTFYFHYFIDRIIHIIIYMY